MITDYQITVSLLHFNLMQSLFVYSTVCVFTYYIYPLSLKSRCKQVQNSCTTMQGLHKLLASLQIFNNKYYFLTYSSSLTTVISQTTLNALCLEKSYSQAKNK